MSDSFKNIKIRWLIIASILALIAPPLQYVTALNTLDIAVSGTTNETKGWNVAVQSLVGGVLPSLLTFFLLFLVYYYCYKLIRRDNGKHDFNPHRSLLLFSCFLICSVGFPYFFQCTNALYLLIEGFHVTQSAFFQWVSFMNILALVLTFVLGLVILFRNGYLRTFKNVISYTWVLFILSPILLFILNYALLGRTSLVLFIESYASVLIQVLWIFSVYYFIKKRNDRHKRRS